MPVFKFDLNKKFLKKGSYMKEKQIYKNGNQTPHGVLYYDILNILACIAVIALHHNSTVWTFNDSLSWKAALGAECFFYWAVPVFFMVSGATLLNYREKYSTGTFFKKRIIRTVIPWLFWSIAVLIWKVSTGQMTLESHDPVYIINLFLNSKIENRYWFFPCLFGLYLAMPIYSMLVKNKKALWYVVIMNFIFVSCVPAINLWTGLDIDIVIPGVSGMIIFPVLGYLVSTTQIKFVYRLIIYALGLAGTIFRYIYTYIESFKIGETSSSIKGYGYFYSVMAALAVFILIKHIPWEKVFNAKLRRGVSVMASASFGVYLIHSIVMYYEVKLLPFAGSKILWQTVLILMTYIFALVIALIIGKIPILKKVAGK